MQFLGFRILGMNPKPHAPLGQVVVSSASGVVFQTETGELPVARKGLRSRVWSLRLQGKPSQFSTFRVRGSGFRDSDLGLWLQV